MAFSVGSPVVLSERGTPCAALRSSACPARLSATCRRAESSARRPQLHAHPDAFSSAVAAVSRRSFYGSRLHAASTQHPSAHFPTLRVVASSLEIATLKKELLSIVAGTNRGFLVSSDSLRAQIDEKITRLEALNPTLAPCEGEGIELLKGTWRLVYTNSLDVVLLARIPALQLGEVFQSYDGVTLTNIAELSGLPPFDALSGTSSTFSVDAGVEIVSSVRVQVNFQRAKLTPGKILGRPLSFLPPLQVPISNSGGNSNTYLDTTFLDEDMRIGRGMGTSVFVLTRVEEGGPTGSAASSSAAPKEIAIE